MIPSDLDFYSRIASAIPPYDHQRRAVNAAVRGVLDSGCHAFFMEMGTGKTKATIDTWQALLSTGMFDAMLVVAPKALLSTWADEELPKHARFDYSVTVWDGRTSEKARREFELAASHPRAAVMIVNVESFQTLPDEMRARVRAFLQKRKALMVIDESSYIKSPDAKRSKNLVLAGKLAKGRLILTGTEITNSPLDLYMQYEYMMPGFWGVKSFYIFRQRYAILEEAYGAGRRTFKKVVGFQRINELLERVAPYCTRALKRDCLDLPEKIHVVMRVEMSDPQKRAYESLKKHLAALIEDKVVTVPNAVALFTKFRQITGGAVHVEGESAVIDPDPPKLRALVADLEDTDEQAIIWAAFTHEIAMLKRELGKIAETVTFHGEDSQEDRDENKRRFQSGEARFIILNPQAGAYGLNLQNAHLQYFYSRTLSPSQNWQAEDRTHRGGQTEACVYKSLVAVGTVDERIETLLAQKTDIRERFQTMTVEDMIQLV